MINLNNYTKAQLVAMIENKEKQIMEMEEDICKYEKIKAYNDITDEIKDIYDKLATKGFDEINRMQLIDAMINNGLIPAKTYSSRRYNRPYYGV